MTIIASNPDDETAYAEQARPRIAATLARAATFPQWPAAAAMVRFCG